MGLKDIFRKTVSVLTNNVVAEEQKAKYNALMFCDPNKLISAITMFNAGSLGMLARIIEEYELRDDKMKTCSKKLRASVARCGHSILIREGFEKDEKAKRHAEILRRFWSGITTTNRFNMNEVGGFTLLKKQMMEAESMGYAVHEIVWRPLENGELTAQFIKMPLWHFENRTGRLRFLPHAGQLDGVEMEKDGWMVTTGDAIGVAAAICACLKRCTLSDWAVFCERCGMPFFIGKTSAAYRSEQWNNLNAALAAIGRNARIQVDKNTEIQSVQVANGATQPYAPFVEWADRAISGLYRGADLSTMSQTGMAVGASLQGDEMGMLEEDACARLSEVLHQQVERFIIKFTTGDEEPLAYIRIEPTKKPNIDTEIKIDEHLIRYGARLSKNAALQRYGRTEVEEMEKGDEPMVEKAENSQRNGVENATEKEKGETERRG